MFVQPAGLMGPSNALSEGTIVTDAEGNYFWNVTIFYEGIVLDGKGVRKILMSLGFSGNHSMPYDHLPSTLGTVTDDAGQPLFLRVITADLDFALRSLALPRSDRTAADLKYYNIAESAKVPAGAGADVLLLADDVDWCTWHRYHTALCRRVFRDLGLMLYLAGKFRGCANSECKHCAGSKGRGAGAGFGGKKAVKKYEKFLRCSVRFKPYTRADGSIGMQASWANRGLVDDLLMRYTNMADLFPANIFKCKPATLHKTRTRAIMLLLFRRRHCSGGGDQTCQIFDRCVCYALYRPDGAAQRDRHPGHLEGPFRDPD